MRRTYKTEINPTLEQKQIIHRTIGVCRYIYNYYIAHNKEVYKETGKFVSGYDFSKWLNNDYLPQHPELSWIKEVSSKSVMRSIMNADKAFKSFFKKKSGYPKFKKKSKSDVKMYFVRTDSKTIILCERHRIKIPTLGWVRIKEKGFIPTNSNTHVIKSGTISMKAGRYYVSVLVEEPDTVKPVLNDFGIGIDLGIKEFAVCSNEVTFPNINKTAQIRKLEQKLKREQRSLARKHIAFKKGLSAGKNLQKQKLKIQKLYQKLNNIRTDYINKVISSLVKTKPSWITIENLNISSMIRNRHLSKAVIQQKFYDFHSRLQAKCKEWGIELRIVDRFYPSSKICHNCGAIKNSLKLSERTYYCDNCGYEIDRDYNASLNLRECLNYTIA